MRVPPGRPGTWTTLGPALLPLVLAAGCASAADGSPAAAAAGPLVTVVRPLGTRQCEAGGATSEALAQTLRDAGVTVSALACGHDGRMRPAVCGAPDGRLAVADIPQAQQARAEALGWQAMSTLPGAQRQACR